MKDGSKLYVVVRGDLNPGSQMAQACHAALEYATRFPQETKEWMDISNHICILTVDTLSDLQDLILKVKDKHLNYTEFEEEDLDNQVTAIAIQPSSKTKKLCFHLPLAPKIQ